MCRDYNKMRRRSLFAVNFWRLAVESAMREAVPEIRIFVDAFFEPLVEFFENPRAFYPDGVEYANFF